MSVTKTMPTKKAPRLQNRRDHFHATVAVRDGGQTPDFFSGPTLESVKGQIDKSLGTTNVYRPDPSNPDVLFVYNSTLAWGIYGEKGASLPIGWLDKMEIPANVGDLEVAKALITQQDLSGDDSMDDIDDLFCAACGDGE